MPAPRIVLAGLPPKLDGLRWEFDRSIRIGRQPHVDLVLHDYSVDRVHAEIKFGGSRWILFDLAAHGRGATLVNGNPLPSRRHELRLGDVLQIGQALLRIAVLHAGHAEEPAAGNPALQQTRVLRIPSRAPAPSLAPVNDIRLSGGDLAIQTVAHHSWEQALEQVAGGPPAQRGAVLSLLKANHHLTRSSSLDDLLGAILADALAGCAAQRGAILLHDPDSDQLVVKAATTCPPGARAYSRTLAERCFRGNESLLCQDVRADQALAAARSVIQGAMASAVCALLRTPQKSLGVLHLDRGALDPPFGESDLYFADALAASVSVGIECAQVVEQQRHQFLQMVTTMARAVELREDYPGDHTRRVTDLALLLAEELSVSKAEIYQLRIGTPLHDIGKIGIDDAILRKRGKLTPAEFDAMKTHTLKGAAILESIGSLGAMIPIVRHHHERWDGGGYPDGLGRERIAITARLVAIADAFAAMTSNRPYRPALPTQLAFLELVNRAGSHFDPACVQAFTRLRPKVEKIMRQS